MSVVIKGSEPFDVMIASNIANCQTANIKFKNISFRCETIEDADGTVFVKIPSAQPEIIRCKDCKHRDPEDKKCDCGHDILWQLPRRDNWYCADAERRTE